MLKKPMAKGQRIIFPAVLERELRALARKKMTYHLRWISAGATLLLGGALWWSTSSSNSSGITGKEIFYILAGIGLFLSFTEGVRLGSDSISKEAREGTLGLLFLTDLKGSEIITGKLAVCSLTAFYSIFATLPVLGLSLLLGGVMLGELFRVGLVLVLSLFYSVSLSLLVSSRCREENRSLLGATLALVTALVLPHIISSKLPMPLDDWITWISPLSAFDHAGDMDYHANPTAYWGRIALVATLPLLYLKAAAYTLRKTWNAESPVISSARSKELRAIFQKRRKTIADSEDVIFNLADRKSLKGLWIAFIALYYLYAVSSAIESAMWLLLPLMLIIFKYWTAWKSSCDFQHARQCGALELWLTTPLTVQQIISGKRQSLNRWLLISLTVVLMTLLLCWFQLFQESGADKAMIFYLGGTFGYTSYSGFILNGSETDIHNLTVLGMIALVFIADMLAIFWMGMWQGLTARSNVQAMDRTFYKVIALPWLIALMPQIYLLFSGDFEPEKLELQVIVTCLTLVVDLAIILYAKRQLKNRFRAVTAEIYTEQPPWWERLFKRRTAKAAFSKEA